MMFILFGIYIEGCMGFCSIIEMEIMKVEERIKFEHPSSVIHVCKSLEEFRRRTGLSPVRGGAFRNDTVYLIPIPYLIRRDALYIIRHEYVHSILNHYELPVYLEEGIAVLVGGPKINPYPFFKKERIAEYLRSKNIDTLRMAYSSSLYYTLRILEDEGNLIGIINKYKYRRKR